MNPNNLNFNEKKKLAFAENSSIDILRDLSKDNNIVIRRIIASNPNTPTEILEKLGSEFPEEIVANPIFDLLLLENPESNFIRLSLARSSTTALETLLKLIEDKDIDIKLAAIANTNTTLEILEKIAKSYQDDDYWTCHEIYLAISCNPNTSGAILEFIAQKTQRKLYQEEIHSQIAGHPNTSTATLEKSSYSWGKTRFYALQHPNISEYAISIIQFIEGELEPDITLLNKLANHWNENIRILVAKYHKVPRWILEILSRDDDTNVREAVASNKYISSELLDWLFTHHKTEKKYCRKNTESF